MISGDFCYLGTPEISATILQRLVSDGFKPALVITRPDAPVGRKRVLSPSPVAQAAEQHQIPLLKANRIGESELFELSARGIQLGVVVAFGALLSGVALTAIPRGWVNLHFSVLPKYRGAAPIQHTLLNREEFAGISLFQLDSGMDSGPVFETQEFAVKPAETAGALMARLSHPGAALLAKWLPALLTGAAEARPQRGEPSFAPKLQRKDCYLDPSQDAWKLEAVVRAANPEPGAWFRLDDRDVKVLAARASESNRGDSTEPGLLELVSGNLALGAAATSILLLDELQPAGKSPMSADAFARGLKLPARIQPSPFSDEV